MTIKVLGIIPARYASTRLPNKLLIPILGKTLLQRTYENACRSSIFDEIVIATDDERIFKHVKQFGGQPLMTSVNCPSGTDRLAEVLLQNPKWLQVDAVVGIQGDHPFIEPTAIESAVRLLLEDSQASMATIATPLRTEEEANNPSIVKCVMDLCNNALYFSRALIPSNKSVSYNANMSCYHHIGLYAYRPEFILHYRTLCLTPLQIEEDLEQLKILEHGYRIKVAVTECGGLGVDTPEDLKKVEQYLCKLNTSL